MSDEELAARGRCAAELVRALRGARTLVEAREIALPDPRARAGRVSRARRGRRSSASPSSGRAPEGLDEAGARIVRELKAVGGDLKPLRLALTGAERGPELWTVVAALPRDEALRASAPI